MTNAAAALRIFLVRGLGLRSANLLVQHFKAPDKVFESTHNELEQLGIPPEVADDLLNPAEPQWIDFMQRLEFAGRVPPTMGKRCEFGQFRGIDVGGRRRRRRHRNRFTVH